MSKLKLTPDIKHFKTYGTAGSKNNTTQGAFSSLSLRFDSTIFLSPAVIFPNQNYEMLIGTSFFKRHKVVINHESNTFYILGQYLPIIYTCDLANCPQQ